DSSEFGLALGEALRKHGLAFFLPGSTQAAKVLSQMAPALRSMGARAIVPEWNAWNRVRGHSTEDLAQQAGILAVKTWPAPANAEHPLLLDLAATPVFLLMDHEGRYRRAFDAWEAVRARESLAKNSDKVSLAVCAPQEHFEVCLIADAAGRAKAASCVRVLASDNNARPWMVASIENATLLEQATRLASTLALQGPLHLQFTRYEGLFYLIDWQPGFPVWIEISHAAGPDLVSLSLEPDAFATGALPPTTPANLLFSQTAEDHVLIPK
ncbi:MAG: hypothetical protein KDB61_10755, partial [Planctomycetes bacterium]|nr:hypothetical protein [Planctomycetota bacterium]